MAARAETLSALGREQGFPWYVARSDLNRGWVMVEEGRVADGIALMRAALSSLEGSHDEEFMPHSLGLLAAALAKGQEVPEALGLAREALARVRRTGERLFEADLHRLEGLLASPLGSRSGGRMLPSSRCTGARARREVVGAARATSLARLWAGQGKHREAS